MMIWRGRRCRRRLEEQRLNVLHPAIVDHACINKVLSGDKEAFRYFITQYQEMDADEA